MDENNPAPEDDKICLIDQINLLIDKKIADERVDVREKIAETKLGVSESRLRFVLGLGAALIAVFGIIVPMWQTQRLKEDVYRAIDKMEERFAELTGDQLRKAEIECYLDGEKLEGAIMHVEREKPGSKLLYIKNTGDKETSAIKFVIYTKDDLGCSFGGYFKQLAISDEIENGFKFVFPAKPLTEDGAFIKVEAGDTETLELRPTCRPVQALETAALLKVYYGRPEPKRFHFTIRVSP